MKYVFLIVLSLLFVSCAQKPTPKIADPVVTEKLEHSDFMSNMIKEYSLTQENLQEIQFYTSHDITLHKQTQVNSISISTEGTLLVDKTSNSNEIIIKASTPCRFVKGDKALISVAFDNNMTLNFVNPCAKGCSTNSRYYLAAQKWDDKVGTLSIKGEDYKVLGVSADTYLTINKKSLENHKRESVVLKGLLVN